jgi:membrane-bound lytic murein transglycosylase MltF
MKPKLTNKVRRGLWLIVARSATVMSAEEGGMDDEREDRDAVLAAVKYAESHWRPKKPSADE